MNGLEQLCNNLASERLQLFSSQMLLAQEEEECRRELLSWVPVRQPPRESCLDLLVDQPHSLLSILDAQTWLSQVRPRVVTPHPVSGRRGGGPGCPGYSWQSLPEGTWLWDPETLPTVPQHSLGQQQ